MTLDPVFSDFLTKFVLPIIVSTLLMFAFGAQGRSRKPHPMLLAVIGELVANGTFDAKNLVNIGVLKPEPENMINPVDVLKLLRG